MTDSARNDRARSSDDESDDGLWNDFESCAQAVAHLFRANTFQNLQAAAARTTQVNLYPFTVEGTASFVALPMHHGFCDRHAFIDIPL